MKSAYIHLLSVTGLLQRAKSHVAKKGIVVLTLHQVVGDAEFESACSQAGMMLRASTFEALLKYLQQECCCIRLDGMPVWQQPEPARMRPRVAITFDDGWRDNFTTALPIAERHETPFAVFLCPKLIGAKEPFWSERVVAVWRRAEHSGKLEMLRGLWKSLTQEENISGRSVDVLIEDLKETDSASRDRFIASVEALTAAHDKSRQPEPMREFLSWNDVMLMSNAGVLFGSHTNTHPILTRISEGEAVEELQKSKAAIEAKLTHCHLFAYPNGDWSESVRQLVALCGYQLAFANSPGIWRQDTHPLSVPRINVSENKLTGTRGRFSKAKLEYAVFWKAYRASGS